MRVVLFVNGRTGLDTVKWLRQEGTDIAGVVVHPVGNARFRDEILDAAQVIESAVVDASQLETPEGVEKVRSLNGEIGLSVYFGYILRNPVINLFPNGIVNVHPAYLPYNRGSYTNVWSIVDSAPAGVSIHYIDSGVDSGDIISRREIEVSVFDTGKTLHERLEDECFSLLRDTWPVISSGNAPRFAQNSSEGTSHKVKDVKEIDRIDLDREYRAGDLIDIIRARTFPPHAGAYFEHNGERVYLRLELLREDELGGHHEPSVEDKEL